MRHGFHEVALSFDWELDNMSFRSWSSYGDFAREVTRNNRYIHSNDVKDFLSNVLATSESRGRVFPLGSVFWRAQLGSKSHPLFYVGEKVVHRPEPFPPERMKPKPSEAPEGRVNPKGMTCLYLATTKETAMAEVRPWLNSRISVWQCKTVKELKLIDCSVHPSDDAIVYVEEPDDQTKEEIVWGDIDRAFSKPVERGDMVSDYVPTQILAELFKRNGFDGVLYRSALSDGLNFALFDIAAATMIKGLLYRTEKIQLSFIESRTDLPSLLEYWKDEGLNRLPPN